MGTEMKLINGDPENNMLKDEGIFLSCITPLIDMAQNLCWTKPKGRYWHYSIWHDQLCDRCSYNSFVSAIPDCLVWLC